jgi:7,8-dihydropterin-6-yl-methyl-4-(beta-D-ribofuranosyl)aminobenzene 5'-phosphate synthase
MPEERIPGIRMANKPDQNLLNMKNLVIFLSLLLLEAGTNSAFTQKQNSDMDKPTNVTLTVLYDNYNFDENFKSSWGFSCLIESPDRTILFDCGGNDGALMDNFKAAGKDPGKVDLVILSHIHWDHTGGLPEFLSSRTAIDVFVPSSFPDEIKEEIRKKGARPVEVKDARKIIDNVWTTGEMGDEIIEQSLIIETPGGLVILTGCAHPGIQGIVEKAMKERGNKILLVMGGFHLLRTDKGTVESIAADFRQLGIQYVAPTHCSGDGTLEIFKKTFGDRFLRAGAGKVIHTSEL